MDDQVFIVEGVLSLNLRGKLINVDWVFIDLGENNYIKL